MLGATVICPYCQANDDKVIDSRATDSGAVIRRRRECLRCNKRFTTYERVEELHRIVVVKRDGTHVPFQRDSILRGVQAACGKRPISEESKQRLVSEVEESLYKDFEREVESIEIGRRVCDKLRVLDEVAYVRFASEYHRFQDAGEFAEEVRHLVNRPKDVKDQQKLF
jgi:transcriptional repressor NrdR